jgi:hypothetical protein
MKILETATCRGLHKNNNLLHRGYLLFILLPEKKNDLTEITPYT